uniref:Phosphotranslferase enzyme family n=1 Tax=Synechocystis sp. PCC 9413 TaxID=77760 RepID=A0A2P0ZGG1_9SYNC|nr:phosphotranslferase enzyme family [Synechocystis sp. PCC 9413]
MSLILNSQNVFDRLVERGLCVWSDRASAKVEIKPAKNFNLLITLEGDRKLLVKQERYDRQGKTAGEFVREWQVQELLNNFREFASLRYLFPEVLDFDRDNSILTCNYLDNYLDLGEFYNRERIYPVDIAAEIGKAIAKIHSFTLNKIEYRDLLDSNREKQNVTLHLGAIDRLTPEIFGIYPADGLKFLSLYQRYDSLGKAIASLSSSYQPCCLTHNDLKLNNLLLANDWQSKISDGINILRFIDWERNNWGDPAFDVGSLVSSYIQIWLSSLVVSKDISLEESLRMATTPLELLQPSLSALIIAYFQQFPQLLQHQPNFLTKVVQFSGLVLIQQIQAILQYQKVFNNTGICMLQVAKSFLCRPEASISTIFGKSASELTSLAPKEPVLS